MSKTKLKLVGDVANRQRQQDNKRKFDRMYSLNKNLYGFYGLGACTVTFFISFERKLLNEM